MSLAEWRLQAIDFACFLCFAFVGATALSAAAGIPPAPRPPWPRRDDGRRGGRDAPRHPARARGLLPMYGLRAQIGGLGPLVAPALRSGLVTFLIALPLVDGTSFAWDYFLTKTGLPTERQDMVDILQNTGSPGVKIALILVATLLVPVTEEVLFRGGLFRYFRTRVPRWAAILVTSLLFGALHVSWGDHMGGLPSLAPLTVLAVVFCLAYERTGSIGTTIVAHALFNLNTFVLSWEGSAREGGAPVLKDPRGKRGLGRRGGAHPRDPALAGKGDTAATRRDRRRLRRHRAPRAAGSSSPSIPWSTGSILTGGVPPREVGAKLFKRNLSDIAAMGGRPRAAVVALALDGRVSLAWLAEFYRGLARESRRHGVPVVGGDVARLSGSLVATLAMTGECDGPRAHPGRLAAGDWIYVTGSLGRSLATGHNHGFKPRLAEGAWLARRGEVRAMMDVSDGLAKDLWAMTPRGAAPALFGGHASAKARGQRPRGALRRRGLRARFQRVIGRRAHPPREGVAARLSADAAYLHREVCAPGRRAARRAATSRTSVATSISDRLRAGRHAPARPTRQGRLRPRGPRNCPPDATVALHGDLGAGKTTWVQGLALGFGVAEPVTSPTFTIYTIHRGTGRACSPTWTRTGSARRGRPRTSCWRNSCGARGASRSSGPERVPGWIPSDAWHLDLGIGADRRHSIRLRGQALRDRALARRRNGRFGRRRGRGQHGRRQHRRARPPAARLPAAGHLRRSFGGGSGAAASGGSGIGGLVPGRGRGRLREVLGVVLLGLDLLLARLDHRGRRVEAPVDELGHVALAHEPDEVALRPHDLLALLWGTEAPSAGGAMPSIFEASSPAFTSGCSSMNVIRCRCSPRTPARARGTCASPRTRTRRPSSPS